MPDSRYTHSRWLPKNAVGAQAQETLEEVRRNTVQRVVGEIETAWGVPHGTLEVPRFVVTSLCELQPHEMKHALIAYLGSERFETDMPWACSVH